MRIEKVAPWEKGGTLIGLGTLHTVLLLLLKPKIRADIIAFFLWCYSVSIPDVPYIPSELVV